MGGKNMRTVIIFGSVHKIFFFGIKYLFIMTGIYKSSKIVNLKSAPRCLTIKMNAIIMLAY